LEKNLLYPGAASPSKTYHVFTILSATRRFGEPQFLTTLCLIFETEKGDTFPGVVSPRVTFSVFAVVSPQRHTV
jgi:hypothetical protein